MSKQKVINLCRGVEASRIRFTFPAGTGSLTVNSTDFRAVATAIEAGTVTVTVTSSFAAGVGATYNGNGTTNTINTPKLVGRVQEGFALHECLHTAFDLARTTITALDEEAAAYVVSSLYFRMSNLAPSRWNVPLHVQGGVVAKGLLHQYATGVRGNPSVDATEFAKLRTMIASDPVYATGPAGTTTPGSYAHDG